MFFTPISPSPKPSLSVQRVLSPSGFNLCLPQIGLEREGVWRHEHGSMTRSSLSLTKSAAGFLRIAPKFVHVALLR